MEKADWRTTVGAPTAKRLRRRLSRAGAMRWLTVRVAGR